MAAAATGEPVPAASDKPAQTPEKQPANDKTVEELEGQVVQVSHDANQYATAKSVTQVIFTTSAIASNVTLWNQLDRGTSRFTALNCLIWISVALNIFVILLATYLSFQKPKTKADKKATGNGNHASSNLDKPSSCGVEATVPGGAGVNAAPQAAVISKEAATTIAIPDPAKAADDAGGAVGNKPPIKGTAPQWPMMKELKEGLKEKEAQAAAEEGRCHKVAPGCCAGGTHAHYHGDTVELCGLKLYSRSNIEPSWACCDFRCFALFRVAGTGKGLGVLSVNPSKKRRRHFMNAKNNLLNEVIGILAVLIVIFNVIISAMAATASKPLTA